MGRGATSYLAIVVQITPVLPKAILWAAAFWTLVLMGIDGILTALFTHHSGYQFFWTLAAIFMGRDVLHWPAIFDFAALSAAWTALFIISVGYMGILGWLILPSTWKRPLLAGAGLGIFYYFVTLYSITRPFPWLATDRNWITLVSYIVAGAISAWWLKGYASNSLLGANAQ
jgi:hypothetical protein